MEDEVVLDIACNNGTSALVTEDGEIFAFGKDCTIHSNRYSLKHDSLFAFSLLPNDELFQQDV